MACLVCTSLTLALQNAASGRDRHTIGQRNTDPRCCSPLSLFLCTRQSQKSRVLRPGLFQRPPPPPPPPPLPAHPPLKFSKHRTQQLKQTGTSPCLPGSNRTVTPHHIKVWYTGLGKGRPIFQVAGFWRNPNCTIKQTSLHHLVDLMCSVSLSTNVGHYTAAKTSLHILS